MNRAEQKTKEKTSDGEADVVQKDLRKSAGEKSAEDMSEGKKDDDEDKEKEKMELRSFEFFHGFLPREDLPYLLGAHGDFILRVSEIAPTSETADANNTRSSKIQWDIILSVVVERVTEGATNEQQNEVRNIVIRRKSGKYTLDSNRRFDSIKSLIDFYKSHEGKFSNFSVILKNGVKLQTWEFTHVAVTLKGILGEGAFGEVRRGVLRRQKKNVDVAVKMTKGAGELSKPKIREMMKEARLMRNFRHKNIVRIYGVAVDEEPLYIILELVNGGALNTYLQKHMQDVDVEERVAMCRGAAKGLAYLHANNCIHRDVAARNCLYSNQKVVKISDFGLSRLGLEYKLSSHCKLPIKWLAPETITTFYFTPKTDAYSFAVLCYEVWTSGMEPWEGTTNTETKRNVTSGRFPKLPEVCPEQMRTFVHERLFVKDPEKRASMKEVVIAFAALTTRKSCLEEPISKLEKEESTKDRRQKMVSVMGSVDSSAKQKRVSPAGAPARGNSVRPLVESTFDFPTTSASVSAKEADTEEHLTIRLLPEPAFRC